MSSSRIFLVSSLLFITLFLTACGKDNRVTKSFSPVSYTEPVATPSPSVSTGNSGNPQYKSSWYSVEYPHGFKAIPSLNNVNGTDSAFFRSPDRRVFFYACSAQWIADCSDIRMNPQTEVLASERRPKTMGKLTRLYTLRAKDYSYMRSYQEVKSVSGYMRSVIGLKYQDEAALEEYRDDYLRFKQSFQHLSK